MDDEPVPVDHYLRSQPRPRRQRRLTEDAAERLRAVLGRGDTRRGVERLEEAGALDD